MPHLSDDEIKTYSPLAPSVSPAKVFRALIFFVLLLFAFSSLLSFLKYALDKSTNIIHILLSFFYLDNENNIPTYFSSILLLTAALLLFYISLHKFRSSNQFKYNWLILSAVFLILSMDEFMSVHELMIEPMQELLNPSGVFYFAWVIPGMVFVGALGLLFLRFLIKLKASYRNKFIISAILFLGGALGIEMIGGYINFSLGTENYLYAMAANLEEALEMIGISYFIYSLLLYVRDELKTKLEIQLQQKVKHLPLIGKERPLPKDRTGTPALPKRKIKVKNKSRPTS